LENLVNKIVYNLYNKYKINDSEINFINFVVDDTKKRWKNQRDSYTRNKRKPGTGSAAQKKKWSLAPHLTFLDQVECERK